MIENKIISYSERKGLTTDQIKARDNTLISTADEEIAYFLGIDRNVVRFPSTEDLRITDLIPQDKFGIDSAVYETDNFYKNYFN